MRLGRLSALLAKGKTATGIALRSRLEIRPNRFQQRPLPFNQWFHRKNVAGKGEKARPGAVRYCPNLIKWRKSGSGAKFKVVKGGLAQR